MSQEHSICVISEKRECKASPTLKEVFIIGPGSHEFSDDILTIKEIVKNFGFEPYFALLSEQEKGLDTFCDKICSKIKSDFFCIALLNSPITCNCEERIMRACRPNVYYEYGLAVAFGKNVIPIIRKDLELPFDIQHIDAILYNTLEELGSKLTSSINALLVKGIKPKEIVKTPKIRLLLFERGSIPSDTLIVRPVIKRNSVNRVKSASERFFIYSANNQKKAVEKDLIPLGLYISNDGQIPANNVMVKLEFPENCELIDKFLAEGVEFNKAIVAPITMSTPPTSGGLYIQKSNVASAWLNRLGNDRAKENFNEIYVNFHTATEKTILVKGTVVQDDYPKSEFNITIEVKPELAP